MKKQLLIIVISLLFAVSCEQGEFKPDVNIVPEPVELTVEEGYFTLNKKTAVFFQNMEESDDVKNYILDYFSKNFGLKLKSSTDKELSKNVVKFIINNPQIGTLEDEGYHLKIEADEICIQANTEAGLVYAMQTLFQLIPTDMVKKKNRSIKLPILTVVDFPRFEWRGSHLDVCRHFFDVDYIKKHLDVMALYKLNKFHWHLTDDQGWRLQIDKYPELTEIGAWRVDRSDVSWKDAQPAKEGEKATYGGYFTKEQVLDIINYAAVRQIEVIPEIEIPGHSSAILASYPAFACDDHPYTVEVGPYWPPKAILCAGNDQVMLFLKDVLTEVAELFPSEYIHIGGDEAIKDNWKACPKCQARIKDLHLKNEDALQSWMINDLEEYLKAYDKQIIGWDDITDGGVSQDATVMFWRSWLGDEKVKKIVDNSNDVIMVPNSYCYFDYYQADKDTEPEAICCYVPIQKVYAFDPVPGNLSSSEAKYIKGGQCNLWSEFLYDSDQVEYMFLPRALALSESIWSPKDKKSWDNFLQKLPRQKELLKTLGYKYCDKIGLIED